MSFKSNPFDRFSHFDPESKLSEFRKNFFQKQNQMFADSNRWPNGGESHSTSKSPKTDNNRFEVKEEEIPIKVIHHQSDNRPNIESNDEKNQDSMSSFGSSQSQQSSDTSNSGGSVFHSNRSRDSSGGEPRVYHIPITVEPREGSTSSGYTSEVNASTEQPLSRTSSHSSAHSTGSGSTRSENRSFSPANSFFEPLNTSMDKKERQIPIKVETNDNQRSATPPKESMPNVKNKGTTQSKLKPKSGPFVTRIPVVNQNLSPPPMKESTPESNAISEPKVAQKVDPLVRINEVLNDLKKYDNEVKQFKGTAYDKEYKFLDEMLTRCMIKLDTIETNGIEEVRKSRKAAVLAVNQCIALLESKIDKSQVNVNTAEEQSVQSDEAMQTSTPEPTHQQIKEETLDSNRSESQKISDNCQQTDTKTENNEQTNDSAPNQNHSQNETSDNTTECQRKETAV